MIKSRILLTLLFGSLIAGTAQAVVCSGYAVDNQRVMFKVNTETNINHKTILYVNEMSVLSSGLPEQGSYLRFYPVTVESNSFYGPLNQQMLHMGDNLSFGPPDVLGSTVGSVILGQQSLKDIYVELRSVNSQSRVLMITSGSGGAKKKLLEVTLSCQD